MGSFFFWIYGETVILLTLTFLDFVYRQQNITKIQRDLEQRIEIDKVTPSIEITKLVSVSSRESRWYIVKYLQIQFIISRLKKNNKYPSS